MAQGATQQIRELIELNGARAPDFAVREAQPQGAGWPEALPQPVILEAGGRSGVGYITDDQGRALLLMHDPQAFGEVMVYDAAQLRADFDVIATPLVKELKQAQPRDIYHGVDVYAGSSESLVKIKGGDLDGEVRRKVILGDDGKISALGDVKLGDGRSVYLADPHLNIGDALPEQDRILKGDVPDYDAYYHSFRDNPEASALYRSLMDYNSAIIYQNSGVAVQQNVSDAQLAGLSIRVQGGDVEQPQLVQDVAPVIERVQEGPADFYMPPEPVQAVRISPAGGAGDFMQKIGAAESHMDKLGTLDREKSSQARVMLSRLEQELKNSPDLSDSKVQQQVEFMFNNPYGIADEYKAVAAQFVQDRLAAGEPIDMTRYGDALKALGNGDVEQAKGALRAEGQEQVVAPVEPRVEEFRGNAASVSDDWKRERAVGNQEIYLQAALHDARNAPDMGNCTDYYVQTRLRETIEHSVQALEGVNVNMADATARGAEGELIIDPEKLPASVAPIKDEIAAAQEILNKIEPGAELRCTGPDNP